MSEAQKNDTLRTKLEKLIKYRGFNGHASYIVSLMIEASSAANQLGIDLKDLNSWCPGLDDQEKVRGLLNFFRSEIVKPYAVSVLAQQVFQSPNLIKALLAFGIDVFDVLPKPNDDAGFDTVLKRAIIDGGTLRANDGDKLRIEVDGRTYELPVAAKFLEVATVLRESIPITSYESVTTRSGPPAVANALCFPENPIDKINELMAGGSPVVVIHRFVKPEGLNDPDSPPYVRVLDVSKEFGGVNGTPVIVPDSLFYQTRNYRDGTIETVRVYTKYENPRFSQEVEANRAIACIFMGVAINRDTGYYGRQPIQIPIHGEPRSPRAWS